MSFKITGARSSGHGGGLGEIGGHGGRFATIISAIALVMSALSYYESSLKTADLRVYIPPMVHYARDGRDVFNIPLTIANDGARTGTVLSMELDVEKLGATEGMKKRRFHSAFLGEYPSGKDTAIANSGRSFAPLAIAGHSTFTETVRFYPMDDDDGVLVDDKGDFRFTLKLMTAKAGQPDLVEKAFRTDPKPVSFDLTMPYFAIQHIAFRNGTQAMFSKAWRAAQSESTDSAASEAVSRKKNESGPPAPPAPEAEKPEPPKPEAPKAEAPKPAPPAAHKDTPPETGGEATPPVQPQAKPAPKR